MTISDHFLGQNSRQLPRSIQPFVLATQKRRWSSWWTLRHSCQLFTRVQPTSIRLSFFLYSYKADGWEIMFSSFSRNKRASCLSVVNCHFMLDCKDLLCSLVWPESRGAQRSCGNAVGGSSPEWGAGHQRPPGCDWATDRLSPGLHQHGSRQPEQVRLLRCSPMSDL